MQALLRVHSTACVSGLRAHWWANLVAEHVFYRFDSQQIVEVWSLIDKETIREQITGASPPSRA